MLKLIVSMALAFAATFASAGVQEEIKKCAAKEIWKGIGVGAAYGGAVGLLTGGLIAAGPLPAGVGATSVVVGTTVTYSLLGAGASLASELYGTIRREAEGIVDSRELLCAKLAVKQKINGIGKAASDAGTATRNGAADLLINAGQELKRL